MERQKWMECGIRGLIILSLASGMLFAQAQQGSIQGHVTDPSGAAIPGAKISVTNPGTNATVIATTGMAGDYVVQNLTPGVYTVTASKVGFKTAVHENVRVVVATPTEADVTLTVGEVTQKVTVTAHPAPITRTSSDIGTALTPQTVKQLPLEVSGSARQLDSFIFLTPGVQGNTFSSFVNGTPAFESDILIDGMPWLNSDEGGSFLQFRPPFGAISQFKMQTDTYSAQYGRGVGIENYAFASGTNQIHGSAFEYLRNNVLDSRGFFNPTVSIEKQNDFGFALGGPVYIPHVYDGRNKSFWYFADEAFKFRGGLRTSLITLPLAQFLQGNFTQLKDANGNLIPIYDPATTRPDGSGGLTRTQFSCNGVANVICPNRISTVTKAFLPLIPTATTTALVNNALVGVPANPPINENKWSLKIDQNIFNSSNTLHASFVHTSDSFPGASPQIPGPLGNFIEQVVPSSQVRIAYDRVISPNMVNTLSVQWMRTLTFQIPENINKTTKTLISPLGASYPNFNFSGQYIGMGTGGSETNAFIPGAGLLDNINWVKGRHNLHFGVDIRFQNEDKLANTEFPGSYNFSPATTSLPDSPNFSIWGNAFASFLLGLPASFSAQNLIPMHGYRTQYYATYIQDDFRMTPKLTLNLGLRWDIPVPVYESGNRMAFFDPNVTNPGAGNLDGAIVFAGTQWGGPCIAQGGASDCRKRYASTHFNEFQPRFGFAYQLNHKTVIRGGYGITYLPGGSLYMWDGSVVSSYETGFRATEDVVSPDGGITPALAWDQGIPAFPSPTPPFSRSVGNGQSVDYMGADSGNAPYVEQWNIGFERQLPGEISLEANYVGNRGVRLGGNMENLNQMNPKWLYLGPELGMDISCLSNASCPNAIAAGVQAPYPGFTGSISQALRPYPQYQFISSNVQETGSSTYEAFQVQAQKYYSRGLSFLVSYTLSKAINNGLFYGFPTFNPLPIDTYDRKREKGLSPVDQPNVLVVSGTYELPIGAGKSFVRNAKGPLQKAIGGWGTSLILSYESGTPIGVIGGPPIPDFGGTNRPNIVRGVNPLASYSGGFNPATDHYLNPAAFSQPAPFTNGGNAPRVLPNAFTFPSYNENFDLIKRTNLTERTDLEFEAEFFNLFNRTIFCGPDGNFNDVIGFGRVGGQCNTPRQIQFGLTLHF